MPNNSKWVPVSHLIAHMCSGAQKCDNSQHFKQMCWKRAITRVGVLHFGVQASRITIGQPPHRSTVCLHKFD